MVIIIFTVLCYSYEKTKHEEFNFENQRFRPLVVGLKPNRSRLLVQRAKKLWSRKYMNSNHLISAVHTTQHFARCRNVGRCWPSERNLLDKVPILWTRDWNVESFSSPRFSHSRFLFPVFVRTVTMSNVNKRVAAMVWRMIHLTTGRNHPPLCTSSFYIIWAIERKKRPQEKNLYYTYSAILSSEINHKMSKVRGQRACHRPCHNSRSQITLTPIAPVRFSSPSWQNIWLEFWHQFLILYGNI